MDFIALLKKTAGDALRQVRWGGFKKRSWNLEPRADAECGGYVVAVNDGPNFYMQYKDDFVKEIYRFEAQRPEPLIIDGGSNMGLSILYFKKLYPKARIVGFEPDPGIFGLLSENLQRNGIGGVKLVNAGLAATEGKSFFRADGKAGGRLSDSGSVAVTMERLSSYLDAEVDFLKLNIEGAELEVLTEAAESGRLRNVRELILEYHGWPGQKQRLGDILNLLDREGYRYLVHDFDAETCFASKPPFHLEPDTTWFCLVYAKRGDLINIRN